LARIGGEAGWELDLARNDSTTLAQPGFFYDLESEGFLVLRLLVPPEMFREGVTRLRRMVTGVVAES